MSSPRLAAACFAGAATPASLLASYLAIAGVIYGHSDMLLTTVSLTFILAGLAATLHICLLGLPLFYIFKKRDWIKGWTAALGGLTIGGLPITLIFSIGLWGTETTTEMWLGLAYNFAFYGLLGMTGSMAAWAIWRFGPDIADR